MLLSLTYGGSEVVTSGDAVISYSAVTNATSGAVLSTGVLNGKGTIGTVIPGQVSLLFAPTATDTQEHPIPAVFKGEVVRC
jgi:hypothetical protein